ncbi:MAG TPA: carbamoyl-phosphate synthase large subunit [Bacillota bacterium]|nr:carbamoyl-phosphate synthase large subunit [Bacillota bacterium]
MKVLVIGSGPIVIGQAAEFDYAGTQACLALKKAGVEVVLVNNNPATIMTDPDVASRVYLEPLTVERLEAVIAKERPEGLLPSLGGQTGLNLSAELAKSGVLDKYSVRLLGTPLEAILNAEDRELFKNLMLQVGIPVPESRAVTSVEAALEFSRESGFPLIVRPAFTLGGTGGGVATDPESLKEIVESGLKNSRISQVLLERSLLGFKEIEFEVIRDRTGRAIIVCGMENVDSVGVHTGDSIVVSPIQTLDAEMIGTLEEAALKTIAALGVEGGCNVQFAVHPETDEFYIIEVNPRVSRSSALASKATGYPIAKVTALLALGKTLQEIKNPETGISWGDVPPKVDYVICKFPRWPFDKFNSADRTLGTQMKATGEIMAIGSTLEEAFGKAVRSLEIDRFSFLDGPDFSVEFLSHNLKTSTDERFFYLAKALAGGMSIEEAARLTSIAPLFLEALQRIVKGEVNVQAHTVSELKELGISDKTLSVRLGVSERQLWEMRREQGIVPAFQAISTESGASPKSTYFYATYAKGAEDAPIPEKTKPRALVIGSGPIRIGQGIEFDYSSVHAVKALQKLGWEAVIINNNPETVSTDFDTADRLYFEPLTEEDVLAVAMREKVDGIIVQFGGQTAINLAETLALHGLPVLGTAMSAIDLAEDREKCHELLEHLAIPQAEGGAAFSLQEAMGIGLRLGFPLVVRPSYVLGGRAMEIVESEEELYRYLKLAVSISKEHPVLIDRYLNGKELEVDAVSDGTNVIIPGILEHIERAGVHSGDSIAVYPAPSISAKEAETVAYYTTSICRALGIRGVVNIQYVIYKGQVYVLEVNPRGSRTLPLLSKVTGVPLVELAVRAMLGESLRDNPYGLGLLPNKPYFAVKAPVFSFAKLKNVEVLLGPEMRSTGEVLGVGLDLKTAVCKALLGAGLALKKERKVLATQNGEILPLLEKLKEMGAEYEICTDYEKNREKLARGQYGLVVACDKSRSDFLLRRQAVEYGIPAVSSPDTLRLIVENMDADLTGEKPLELSECLEGNLC